MNWSQLFVVGWVQFSLAVLGMFWLASRWLRWLPQPADRLRLIQLTVAAASMLPLLIALAPWQGWKLEIVSPVPQAEFNYQREAVATSFTGNISVEQPLRPSPPNLRSVVEASHSPSPKAEDSLLSIVQGHAWSLAAKAILFVHGAALVGFLCLRFLGWGQLRRLCGAATPASEHLMQIWNQVTQGRGKNVRLLVSTTYEVPLMFGWLRPVVLIPHSLAEANGAPLRYCLAHEWAHIERHDFITWKWIDACQILFWLQPAYWAFRKELRLCQDLLADNSSTRIVGDQVEYSAFLVAFARNRMTGHVAGALTFMDSPPQLTRRVKMLLERSLLVRSHCTWRFSVAVATAVGVLAVLISGVRIAAIRAEVVKKDTTSTPPAAEVDKSTVEQPTSLKYVCSVVDKETGKGLSGTRVTVRRSISTPQEHRVLEETRHTTDNEGKYEFVISPEQVATPWLYIELDVEHPDYASKNGFGYSLTMIRKNEKLGERPFFERTGLYQGEAVTGTVLSPDGMPLEGVAVMGYSIADPSNYDSGSFTKTETLADGKFRLAFHKKGDAVFWIIPRDFASVEKFIGNTRGDLGEFRATEGVRVSGRVVNVDRQPLAGVPVNIDSISGSNGDLRVASQIKRGVLSDAEGRFAFDPLPTGSYQVKVDEYVGDPMDRKRPATRYTLPAVFLPRNVELKAGSELAPIEIQAVPHINFHAQYLDSESKPTRGHEVFIFGKLDGKHLFGQGRPDQNGKISLMIPRGLQESQVQLMTNEHGSLRYRRSKEQPLEDYISRVAMLGTLNDDVGDFEIVRYKAPIVLVSAVDDAQQPIPKLEVKAVYDKPKALGPFISLANGSDLNFAHQEDGKYRSEQMLPDEALTLTVSALGYETVSEKVKLNEGATKDLVFTLKKSQDSAASDSSK